MMFDVSKLSPPSNIANIDSTDLLSPVL